MFVKRGLKIWGLGFRARELLVLLEVVLILIRLDFFQEASTITNTTWVGFLILLMRGGGGGPYHTYNILIYPSQTP